jgi:hypothetical protein
MAEWWLGHDTLVSAIVFALYAGLSASDIHNGYETP